MKAAQVMGKGSAGGTGAAHYVCPAGKHGHHTLACVLGYAMGCAMFLSGCASRNQPETEVPPEPEASYVYVLAPASLMVHLDAKNPPLLEANGLPEDLPVFASREDAKKWLEAEVSNDRIIAGLWRIYRLEGQWPTDVVETEGGECRMRHAARILPAI